MIENSNEIEVVFPETEAKGLNLSQLKRDFIKFDHKGRYQTIFYIFTVFVFIVCAWIFITTDLSQVHILLKTKITSDFLYLSNKIFLFLIPVGLILLICVEIVAFWKNKSLDIHKSEMIFLIMGYGFSLAYLVFINPLNQFLQSYIDNQDPFKQFSTSLEVLAKLNFGWMAIMLVFALLSFSIGYCILFFKKRNIELVVSSTSSKRVK